jgi:hypothetical protein
MPLRPGRTGELHEVDVGVSALAPQFVWTNPTTTGPGSPVRRSASDALQLTVL